MSYAIIRNAKHKLGNLSYVSRHNERQNQEYGNKDIDTSRSAENYHLHKPLEQSYEKELLRLRDENDLKGNLRLTGKKQSNVACEFLITSDNDYFRKIGESETRRYFQSAYDFACQRVGEKNIISAVVHMDETTPHMHLTYIPVVDGHSKKHGDIKKINCSEFWKGFNSYGKLQDDFHRFITQRGFDLERGIRNVDREEKKDHIALEDYKLQTVRSRVNELASIEQKLQGQIIALEDRFKGRELTANELHQIQPAKGVMGIKNVTIEDIENLKKTADMYHRAKYELEKVLGNYEHMKQRLPSSDKLLEHSRDRKRLEQLEKAFQNLPPELQAQIMPVKTLESNRTR